MWFDLMFVIVWWICCCVCYKWWCFFKMGFNDSIYYEVMVLFLKERKERKVKLIKFYENENFFYILEYKYDLYLVVVIKLKFIFWIRNIIIESYKGLVN